MANATVTVKASGGDYTTLNAALAGEAADLTANCHSTGGAGILTIECYAMADTTAASTGTGYTTSADYYINITVPASERHDGKWNTNKYYLSVNVSHYGALEIYENYTRMTGLQVAVNGTGDDDRCGIRIDGAGNCLIDRCIVRRLSSSNICQGIRFGKASALYCDIRNSYLYGFDVGEWYAGIACDDTSSNIKIYNCTISGNYLGINGSSHVITNCAVFNNYDDFYGTMTIDYCASDDGDGTHAVNISPGATEATDWASCFVDYANGDFHLNSGSVCVNAGADLSGTFTTDIDGETRVTWDIGADEYVAAGGARTVEAVFDALIQKGYTKTAALDALIKRTALTKTSSLDAMLQKGFTETTAIDAVVQKLKTVIASLDALLQIDDQAKTASLDALIRKTGFTSAASLDALIMAVMTSGTSLDALLQKSAAISASLDAIVQKGMSTSASLDALIQVSGAIKTLAIDALIQTTGVKTVSIDALLRAVKNEAISLDALLQITGVSTTALDAIIISQGEAFVSTSLDALLQAIKTGSISLDALIQAAGSSSVSIDAMIAATMTGSVGLDAILTAIKYEAVATSLDALVQKTWTSAVSLDALIQETATITASLDALIAAMKTGSLSIDAILALKAISTLGLDALVQKALSRTLSLDAIIIPATISAAQVIYAHQRATTIGARQRITDITAPTRKKAIS